MGRTNAYLHLALLKDPYAINLFPQLTRSHLGCLVLDTFNASLTLPKHTNLHPTEGSVCKFKVTEVVVEGEILFVRGVVKR